MNGIVCEGCWTAGRLYKGVPLPPAARLLILFEHPCTSFRIHFPTCAPSEKARCLPPTGLLRYVDRLPFVRASANGQWPKYDPSQPWGGDSSDLKTDVNAQYIGYEFNYIYLIICAFLVWLIIPGIGLLYGGLSRRKSGLSLLFQSLMVIAVVTFQWMFWGYSLTYAQNASPFFGTMQNVSRSQYRLTYCTEI